MEGYRGKLKIGLYDRAWLPKLFGDRGQAIISGHPFLLSMTVDDLELVYQHLSVTEHQQTTQDISKSTIDIIAPPQIMPWGQKILFLADPDGNLIEIVQR